jgi:predicted RNase H-like HicB family nuclease
MKYRAIIKKSDGWWIGWLVDLPGVNAQERTKEELLKSLAIGAEDMLATQVPFEPGGQTAMVEVPDPGSAPKESRA